MSPAPRAGAIVGVLSCAGIAAALMQTLVVPLIGELPRLLDTSAANASWVLTATLLAGAVATPVVGRMGDLYGKRRVLLGCVLLLVVGSVVGAMANSLVPMVVGRALQGLAAGIIPLGISIMRDVLPPERLGSSIALMSSSLGMGGAFGLPLSAVIVDNADWHMLFWGTAGIAALIGVMVFLTVPESPVRDRGRFDYLGAAGLSAGLVCLLLAVSKGGDWGWASRTTLGLFAAAVLILLLWGVWELRVREPLVDLRATARRQVLMTNLASIVVGFSMYAMSVLSPQLLQLPAATGYGLGQSMLAAGLWMAPAGLVMMVVSPLGAKLSAAAGPKISLLTGALIIAAGYGSALPLMGEAWGLLLFSCVCSAGVAFAYGAMPALIMSAVPASETAAANGFNTLMRSIGTSTSSAVIGVVLANMTVQVGPVSVPSENGFRAGFLIGAGVAVAAALVALAIPGRRAAPAAPAAADLVPAAPAAAVSAPIRGTVLSESGPVAGAAVTLIDGAGRQIAHGVSGADGRYALDTARSGAFLLVGSAAGFQPEAVPVEVAGAPVDTDVRLAGPAGAGGTVRDAVTGEPVPGATVVAVNIAGEVTHSAATGLDGTFFLPGLDAADHTLAVRAAGYRPKAFQGEPPGAVGSWTVTLDPGLAVSGTVRGTSGRPLPGVRVAVLDSGGDLVAATVTGADGGYRFGDLAAADYTLVASGYAPVTGTIDLTGHGVDAFDLRLSRHADPQPAAPVQPGGVTPP
ncbi:MFS transporter [Actinomadura vinacea]|uniref:MFS transporter n=1 Tax=Actinomadura vinacea TaxID=115336 RepID=A0ABN3JLN6_9ACTN